MAPVEEIRTHPQSARRVARKNFGAVTGKRLWHNLQRMRRFIVLLLLMLVPLQAAFGAAAGYCEDERTEVATHFGHHEHEGGVAAVEPPDDSTSAKADCQICHLASAQAPVSADVAPSGTAAALVFAPKPAARADHPQHPFDRPPKSALA